MKTKAHKKSRVKNSSNSSIFSGEYRVCVSENRITLPTKIYTQLRSVDGSLRMCIIRSQDDCIVLVPERFWDYYCDTITEGKTSYMKDKLMRTYIAAARTVGLKSQRRLAISSNFMISPLGESKRVVLVGVGCWIEIWAEEQWERTLNRLRKGKKRS